MERFTVPSKQGYAIPCRARLTGASHCLLICHGFGSSQESPTVQALHAYLPSLAVDSLSFDFPFHGESTVGAASLRLSNCLSDLECMEAYLQQRSPATKPLYFGSSFGAYILLLHFARHPQGQRFAFLRSAAVRMSHIMQSWLSNSTLSWQDALSGDPLAAYCPLDPFYGRSFGITAGFVQDLAENDLFSTYPISPAPTLSMIHGEADSTALLRDASDFAALVGASLQVLPHAEHRLMGTGEQNAVLEAFRQHLTTAQKVF